MTEVKRGLASAKKFHDENTGAPFRSVILKEDGQSVVVRVLQKEDVWLSLFMHRHFVKQIPSTRCADQADEPDMEACLMCAHGIPRQLRMYIPVRVRGDEVQDRVQFFDYGRDNLAEVINQLEELKEGQSITDLDFKVKRQGKGTDTKYRWVPTGDNARPLTEDETSLVIPPLDELIVIPSDARQKALCNKFGVVGDDEDEKATDKPKRTPF